MKMIIIHIILLSIFYEFESAANITKAIMHLTMEANYSSSGYCARHVSNALAYGGFIFNRPGAAYEFRTKGILTDLGFKEISKPNLFYIGDVTVTEKNEYYKYGHVAMFNGTKWVSDFAQNSEYVYRENQPPIHYYRYYPKNKTILTSFYSCKTMDNTKCSSVVIKEREFSNYQCSQNGLSCSIVPTNSNLQKTFQKISDGEDKEIASKNYEKFLSGSYGSFSKEDTEIIQRKNTCSYISFGKFYESNSKSYSGISDKNLCFNAEQFSDLKGLVNCGYAEVNVNIRGQIKSINLCSYMPSKDMNKDLLPYFKYRFIDKIIMDDLSEIIKDGSIGRRLEENELSYKIEVEDKDGRKVKYTDENYDVELILGGKSQTEENTSKKIYIKQWFFYLFLLYLFE